VATLFAFASYLGTLIVLGVVCFGFGKYDPRFGASGSFVVMAAIFAVFLPFAALGFYLAKRTFVHATTAVALSGVGSGLAASLMVFLIDWMFSQQLMTYAVPVVGIFVAGFASARLTETEILK
jgi:hypothetical protein